jgi:HEAT repeat protein
MPDAANLVANLLCGDDGRAEAAARDLARLGPPALDVLLPHFTDAAGETRWWVVRAVAGIPDPRSAAVLTAALEDREPEVRQAAALGFRLQPVPQAAARLARHLADPDPLTARLASEALAALGPAALDSLRPAARSPQPATRLHAVRALALMKDRSAIPELFAALDDPSTLVQHWAERGLEDLGVGMVFFNAG